MSERVKIYASYLIIITTTGDQYRTSNYKRVDIYSVHKNYL